MIHYALYLSIQGPQNPTKPYYRAGPTKPNQTILQGRRKVQNSGGACTKDLKWLEYLVQPPQYWIWENLGGGGRGLPGPPGLGVFWKSATKFALPGVLPEREMPPEFDEESPRSLVRYDIFKILEPELEIRLICCLSLVEYLNMIIQHPYDFNLYILKCFKIMLVRQIYYQSIDLKSKSVGNR